MPFADDEPLISFSAARRPRAAGEGENDSAAEPPFIDGDVPSTALDALLDAIGADELEDSSMRAALVSVLARLERQLPDLEADASATDAEPTLERSTQ